MHEVKICGEQNPLKLPWGLQTTVSETRKSALLHIFALFINSAVTMRESCRSYLWVVLDDSEIYCCLNGRQRGVDSADREVSQRAEFVCEREQRELVSADLKVADVHIGMQKSAWQIEMCSTTNYVWGGRQVTRRSSNIDVDTFKNTFVPSLSLGLSELAFTISSKGSFSKTDR